MEDVQYCAGYSVLWRIFSIVGSVLYCRDTISTVEDIQYCGGIPSVLWRMFSTVGDIIITGEDIQYCRGYQHNCGGYSVL